MRAVDKVGANTGKGFGYPLAQGIVLVCTVASTDHAVIVVVAVFDKAAIKAGVANYITIGVVAKAALLLSRPTIFHS